MGFKLETTNDFKELAKANPDLVSLSLEELKRVQQIGLEAVHDIVSVCNDLGTNYHLSGGSALGAVRHHGFIPWDDDVDIDVARKDLNLFLQEFSARFSDKYWIHGPNSKDQFCVRCYQIRRKNTVFQGCTDATDEESGICVDLPVMENTFDNAVLRKLHGGISLALGLVVSCRRFFMNRRFLMNLAANNEGIKRKFRAKIMIGALFSFASLRSWTMLYDRWNALCHNEASKYVTVPTGRNHFFKETYLRSAFAATTTGRFEDLEVKIPKDWDSYLRHMYGDYMQIPPEEEREQHLVIKLCI